MGCLEESPQCARRRIPLPRWGLTRRPRRGLGLAVPRGVHTFLSVAKEKCAKESRRHGDSRGGPPRFALFANIGVPGAAVPGPCICSGLPVANCLRQLCPPGDGELFKFYLKSSVCQRQTGLPIGNPPCGSLSIQASSCGSPFGAVLDHGASFSACSLAFSGQQASALRSGFAAVLRPRLAALTLGVAELPAGRSARLPPSLRVALGCAQGPAGATLPFGTVRFAHPPGKSPLLPIFERGSSQCRAQTS